MRGLKIGALLLCVVMLVGLWVVPPALAEEKLHRGGMLRVALAGDPPSLDMHQEQTFMVTIPLSPVYNTLVTFDPHGYPKVIGDLAKSWTVSEDGMTYTFTLHQGVKFHDGSELTSADVKASWEKIISPPEGVVSPRKSEYEFIKSIAAPDPYTVVFRLHYAAASFLPGIAHPANFIYAKKYLDQDPNYYKQKAMGTGPFKLKEYVHGASIELVRNPNYWKQGFPYMDGMKYFIIKDDGARAKSIRADRTDVEFRGFSPTEVEALQNQMGEKVVVARPGYPVHWGIAVNVDKKPFDDERVRKALSLALDRYDMAKTIGPLTGMDTVGGPQPPGSLGALTAEELAPLPGFSKDYEASLKEAKHLLAEAGYPNGFKTVLTNRAVKLPYIDFAVYVISAWKKIGVEAEHKVEESATWSKSRLSRDFELLVNPFGFAAAADPDEVMSQFISVSPANWGRYKDPVVDELFDKQKVERDEQKRAQLVKDMQKRIIEKSWQIMGLWWTRIEVRSARIRNYEPMPSHWLNRRLEDVWLSEK
jgi:peptide/nickel transport system substrate-binding protein